MTKRSSKATSAVEALEGAEAAREAGLVYVSDEQPGIRRRRSGRGFAYTGPDGSPIRNRAELRRIKALAVPPAWTDVWICATPRGHIQATGRDARRRKQYRYHHLWRRTRDRTKYDRMTDFGRELPAIRRRVREDLALPDLPRDKVLATVVRLIDLTYLRVGNARYARENGSYGLTTMRNRHVDVSGDRIRFEFRGKAGKVHTVGVRDPRLARIVKRCQEIPGQHLFQYLDEQGERRPVDSDDVNAYLQEIAGEEFTAKDFRTWAGTVLATSALREVGAAGTARDAQSMVVRAIESVAAALGNTVAVCRACYVHPAVIEAFLDGSLLELRSRRGPRNGAAPDDRLRPDETTLLAFLRSRESASSKVNRRRGRRAA